jgi:hypothetical protein
MDLKTYFDTTEPAERRQFAEQLGKSERYLYLCSRGDRRPGSDLCKQIVKLDPRFTLAELRPDIWGDGVDELAATDDTQNNAGGSVDKGPAKARGGSSRKKKPEQRAV